MRRARVPVMLGQEYYMPNVFEQRGVAFYHINRALRADVAQTSTFYGMSHSRYRFYSGVEGWAAPLASPISTESSADGRNQGSLERSVRVRWSNLVNPVISEPG